MEQHSPLKPHALDPCIVVWSTLVFAVHGGPLRRYCLENCVNILVLRETLIFHYLLWAAAGLSKAYFYFQYMP